MYIFYIVYIIVYTFCRVAPLISTCVYVLKGVSFTILYLYIGAIKESVAFGGAGNGWFTDKHGADLRAVCRKFNKCITDARRISKWTRIPHSDHN